MLDVLLAANKKFVGEGCGVDASKYPRLHLAVLACMDTRLVGLLEPALGLSCGDAIIIKNAGNVLDEGALRSLVVAVYQLGVDEIIVIGHSDCGMAGLDVEELRRRMLARGVSDRVLESLNLTAWTGGFEEEEENVRRVVEKIVEHPLLPRDVKVHGLLMETGTGRVRVLVYGKETGGKKV